MLRALILIFVLYIIITQHLISGYGEMNDKLQAVNDNLLAICSKSTLSNPEKQRY